MKKKIMGVCAGAFLLAVVIWGYENYGQNGSVKEEEIQSELTAKRQDTSQEETEEKDTLRGKKESESEAESETGAETETETETEKRKGTLITAKQKTDETDSETDQQEDTYGSPLIKKKEEESEPQPETAALEPLIKKKDPSETQPETYPDLPVESWQPGDEPAQPQTEGGTEAPMYPQTQEDTEKLIQPETQKDTEKLIQSEVQEDTEKPAQPQTQEGTEKPTEPETQKDTEKAEVSVFATASLKKAAQEIKEIYEKENPDVSVVLTVEEEEILSQKIQAGEAFDIYLTSSLEELEALAEADKVDGDSIQIVAEDPIVLVQMEDGETQIKDFSQIPEAQDVTIAEETTVLGKASREVLQSFGVYDQVMAMDLSEVGNANAVMASVSTQSSELGLVYGTDAANAEGLVEVIAQASEDAVSDHLYYYISAAAEQNKTTQIEEKDEFLNYLKSDEASETLEKNGLCVSGF